MSASLQFIEYSLWEILESTKILQVLYPLCFGTKTLATNFGCDRNENSLQKKWAFIQSSCNKKIGAYDDIKGRSVSGIRIKDMVFHALALFKE